MSAASAEVMRQFEPRMAASLLEFGHTLSQAEADFVIFVARKSLCLYDLLRAQGVEEPRATILSDRVLDLDLRPFAGKRVLLVDDTLIVGTTLSRLQKRLEAAGAIVRIFVFCADEAWWVRNLVQPNKIQHVLTDESVMTFCAAEVRAFGLLPRPYHTDFPMSEPVQIPLESFSDLLSQIAWESHDISSFLQERSDVHVYTFLPTATMIKHLEAALGSQFFALAEIAKVRFFCRIVDGMVVGQFVPMITLRPAKIEDVSMILRSISAHVARLTGIDASALTRTAADSPLAAQRLAQFWGGLVLLRAFERTAFIQANSNSRLQLDSIEALRHVGPWYQRELQAIWDATGDPAPLQLERAITRVSVPVRVAGPAREFLARTLPETPTASENVVARFTEIFLALYHEREIPARIQARDQRPPKQEAEWNDRLEVGIPWGILTEAFAPADDIREQRRLSLVLDKCVDLGIAVPITCVSDGIVYRAYRHGEDVRFTDSELGLAFEVVRGFVRGSGAETVPRFALEKLLVLLMRVGLEGRFLEPFFGTDGHAGTGTVRTRFDLHGAVAKHVRPESSHADHETWLSSYLVKRNVLAIDKPTGQYKLGNKREGNYLVLDAENRAYQLGNILGLLWRGEGLRKDAPLDDRHLTALTTCSTPRDAAAALVAELGITKEAFLDDIAPLLAAGDWTPDGIARLKIALNRSKAYLASNQAHLKTIAYHKRQAIEAVWNGDKFLSKLQNGDLMASLWRGYWINLTSDQPHEERDRFDPLIRELSLLLWEINSAYSALRVAVEGIAAEDGQRRAANARDEEIATFHEHGQAMMELGYHRTATITKLQTLLRRLKARPTRRDFEDIGVQGYDVLKSRLPGATRLIARAEEMIEAARSRSGLLTYSYVLIYDVIDSTGTKLAELGGNVEAYRATVLDWKRQTNERIRAHMRTVKKEHAQLFICRGTLDSFDDEKHIFVGGPSAVKHLTDTLGVIMEGAYSFPDVKLRILVAPCEFSGGSAFRRPHETEVSGAAFWEHMSRLRPKAKLSYEVKRGNSSSLSIVTDQLNRVLRIPTGLTVGDESTETFETEIAGLSWPSDVRMMRIQLTPPTRVPVVDPSIPDAPPGRDQASEPARPE